MSPSGYVRSSDFASAVRDLTMVSTTVSQLTEVVTALGQRLHVVEAHPPTPQVQAVGTGTPRLSRRARRQNRAALRRSAPAPPATPAATSAPRIAATSVPPSLPKAALEKIVVHLFVPDAVAGHIIGRSGTGLRQIHDLSHAKVSIAQTVGPQASRTVTIRGTAREVGDAVSAIGKRIARRRVRQPKSKKVDKGKARPRPPAVVVTSSTSSTPATPHAAGSSTPRQPSSSTPRASSKAPATPGPTSSSASTSASVHPMSGVQTAGSSSTLSPGSPMSIDAARASSSSKSSSSGKQTAKRTGEKASAGDILRALQ